MIKEKGGLTARMLGRSLSARQLCPPSTSETGNGGDKTLSEALHYAHLGLEQYFQTTCGYLRHLPT
jgi:hypothetical protein